MEQGSGCGDPNRHDPGQRQTRAVILAAGRGSRMGSITKDRPKCLLRVGGHTLLEHQLATLLALGVSKISVVAGYCAGQVRDVVGGRAEIIVNDDWAETNSLYSFWLCRDWCRAGAPDESLLVLNGDVLAHPTIIERVLSSSASSFAYDSASGRDEEHMGVELQRGRLYSMHKDLPEYRVHGENVGILHFAGSAPSLLLQEAAPLLEADGLKLWLASAVERIAQKVPLYGIDISPLPWREIDFPEDLRVARSTTWPAICASPWAPRATSAPHPKPKLPPVHAG
jgi:choline kinase